MKNILIIITLLINILQGDNTSFKGQMFVTSLDPEFHFGQGFMPKTEPFFDGFMSYVFDEVERRISS